MRRNMFAAASESFGGEVVAGLVQLAPDQSLFAIIPHLDQVLRVPARIIADYRNDPGTGADRVARGGSYGVVSRVCRSAYRGGRVPVDRFRSQGFRVAGSVPPSSRS